MQKLFTSSDKTPNARTEDSISSGYLSDRFKLFHTSMNVETNALQPRHVLLSRVYCKLELLRVISSHIVTAYSDKKIPTFLYVGVV